MARPVSARGAAAAAPPPPGARLAANQLKRLRRIVDAATDLAEVGGFENVRLRDVAERSDVALGTLYKYFRSKEDLLLFALHEEIERFEHALTTRPVQGDDPLERVTELFRRATAGLLRKPHLARAVVRAMATAGPHTAVRTAGLHLRLSRLIVAALRAETSDTSRPLDRAPGSAQEQQVASTLILVWFATQVGWASDLHPGEHIHEQIRNSARLVLDGARACQGD